LLYLVQHPQWLIGREELLAGLGLAEMLQGYLGELAAEGS